MTNLRNKKIITILILCGISAVILIMVGYRLLNSKPQFIPPPVPTSNAGTLLLVSGGQSVEQLSVTASGVITGTPASATTGPSDLSPECIIGGQVASPDGKQVAIKIYCDEQSYTRVLDVTTGEVQDIQTKAGPESRFLGWSPDGRAAVVWSGYIEVSQIQVVNLKTGDTEILDTPPHTYNAAISPDNDRVLFVVTKGLGWGGELWMMRLNGGNQQMILQDPTHLISFPSWSPDMQAITYIRMEDSSIPFTIGELCLADGDGHNQRCVAAADAGHGYPPVWSPDSKWVAFVVRENPDDVGANNESSALISNIYLANPQTNETRPLTHFENAIVNGAVWSPNGQQLAFRKTENGLSDIWLIDIATGELQQVTQNGNASWPVWLSQGNALQSTAQPTEEK